MYARALFAISLFCFTSYAQQPQDAEPSYTKDGQLKRPANYREWIYLSSGLGMTYGPAGLTADPEPEFDNVFVAPQAYKAFLRTGTWPDKTLFVLEVRHSASKGSINHGGHYQEDVAALEIHLKDEKRFPNKWSFFAFGTSGETAKPFPPASSCQTCHAKSGAVDETFVQFYPTLIPIAKAKGTLKPGAEK